MTDAIAEPQKAPEAKTFGQERLSPGFYTLDLSAVTSLAMKVNGEASTFGDAYCKLTDSKIQQMPDRFSASALVAGQDKYVAQSGTLLLEGDWPLRATMRTLIDLMRRGIDPYSVMWLYYDSDWSRDMDESHVFFAVHSGKVIESCDFSGREPLVLKRWHSHSYFDEAEEIYWYRKFYTETKWGQLMVLRPDEPILYHYERAQTHDVVRDAQFVTLIKMYRLLWVAIPLLAAIAFPLIKYFMGIVAVILLVDVLWRCWATRRVGQDD